MTRCSDCKVKIRLRYYPTPQHNFNLTEELIYACRCRISIYKLEKLVADYVPRRKKESWSKKAKMILALIKDSRGNENT